MEPQRILVVDDDYGTRFALRRLFTKEGYAVDTAADGAEALTLVTVHHFDLIFLDLEMPIMGGLDLLQRLPGEATVKRLVETGALVYRQDTVDRRVELVAADLEQGAQEPFGFGNRGVAQLKL